MIEINYLAVLSAAVASTILGALWYSPVLFAKQWMKFSGKNPQDIKNGGRSMAIGFLFTVLMSYVLAHGIELLQVTALGDALELGFWIWLGFVVTFSANSVLYEGKHVMLFVINNGYNLASLMLMVGILVSW